MSNITTIQTVSLSAFKTIANTTKLNFQRVTEGKRQGRLFATGDDGVKVCNIAPDIDVQRPVMVQELRNEETGSQWWWLFNATEDVHEATGVSM